MQKSTQAGEGRIYLDQGTLRDYLRSDRYTAGMLQEDVVTLNPHKLLEGLAALAEERGAVIAENTAVTHVGSHTDGSIEVRSEQGAIRAKRSVVAAGTGNGALVQSCKATLLTAYAQVAVTQPIDMILLDSVLPSWAATSEIIAYTRYFRRVPGNRLLFGTSTMLDSIAGAPLQARIRVDLADTFPSLADVPFETAWEGGIAGTVSGSRLLERIAPTAVVTSSNGVLTRGTQAASRREQQIPVSRPMTHCASTNTGAGLLLACRNG